ncbi:MAG: class I SAM-dependent methyltransferase [Robiginitomaculum sp.]|nr:class I SAM-dependent methyltransferase [Robiginitomaculum sp.]
MKTFIFTAAIALSLAACQQAEDAPEVDMPASENEAAQDTQQMVDKAVEMADAEKAAEKAADNMGNHDAVMKAMQAETRPEADLKDDALRKTADVLVFTGVSAGMTVVDLEAGSGYYTELFSRIVGENGKVIMQNPQRFDAFIKPEVFEARLGKDGERLKNVTHIRGNFDVLDVPDASADLVTWFLGPHELWLKDEDGALTLGAPDDVYAEIYRVLKPGGKFIALDHKAAPGSPATTGGTTHRIDPVHILASAEKAGFVFKKDSDVLANPADNYDIQVFDSKVRRKTDRFLHMYVKPAK